MSNTSKVGSDALIYLYRPKGDNFFPDREAIVPIVDMLVLNPYRKAREHHTCTENIPRLGDVFFVSSGEDKFYFLS